MNFEILGEIRDIETIAIGRSIRELDRLQKIYGPGRWRKLTIKLINDFFLHF